MLISPAVLHMAADVKFSTYCQSFCKASIPSQHPSIFFFLLASKNDVHFPFLFVLSFCPFLSWHLEENLHSQYCFILPKRTEADKRLVPLCGALFLLSPPECWAFHDYLWGMGSSETTNFLLLDLSDLYVSSAFFLFLFDTFLVLKKFNIISLPQLQLIYVFFFIYRFSFGYFETGHFCV